MNEFNVLLVDDEVEFLESLVKRLKKRNINAVGVPSGEEALRLIKEIPVDVAVLDVRMAGMDGIQTLREIKKMNPLVEVIMLTGYANSAVAIEGMELAVGPSDEADGHRLASLQASGRLQTGRSFYFNLFRNINHRIAIDVNSRPDHQLIPLWLSAAY